MYEDMNTENKSYNWDDNQTAQEPKKEEKNSGGFFRKIMIAACCGLCFGLFAGLGLYAVDQVKAFGEATQEEIYQTNSGSSEVVNNVTDKEETEIKVANTNQVSVVTTDYSDVVERMMPAMVSILNTYTE